MAFILASCSIKRPPTPIYTPERTSSLPSLIRLRELDAKAKELLEPIHVGPWCIRNEIPRGREIALAGYNARTQNIETVKIRLCYDDAKNLEVLTSGYSVQYLAGRGITRFSFVVHNSNGDKLLVLLGKHWYGENYRSEYYFPYSDNFLTMDIVREGYKTLLRATTETLEDLRSLNAISYTFPERTVGAVITHELLMNIALIEQMDDNEFFQTCPKPETLPKENQIFHNCAEYAVFKVLVHYARNSEDAFRFVKSDAEARGAMQFTERTYHFVNDLYPRARLNPYFDRGTENFRNSLKAAACLLDLELSNLPPAVHDVYKLNSRVGGLYPIVAYNGGNKRARCVWANGHEGGIGCRASHNAWNETMGYMAKYEGVWNIIDMLKNN